MRLSHLLLPLLALTLPALTLAQSTQSTDASEAAARKALFQSCGGVESGTLPTGVAPGIYRGTLGDRPISLQLVSGSHPADSEQADRYAYDRYGLDITLERGRAANRTASYALLAVEAVMRGDGTLAARGCLDLSADGNTLRGQWRRPDGSARFQVRLSRVNVAAQPLALPRSPGLLHLKATDPFTFLKLNHPWKSVAGGLREPLSGIVYPRVAGASAGLTAALQDRGLNMAAEALGCLGSFGLNRSVSNDYSGSAQVSWNSPRLVSLHENVDYYCGGAHPDAYIAGVTLDARSGQKVTLVGKPGTVWPGLTPAKVQGLYLAKYPSGSDDRDCREAMSGEDGRSTEYPSFQFYLTPAGLVLWPGFLPHVVLACAEEITLPYASLRPLADARSPYFHDVYPR